jgi:hypothetical protein
MDILEATPSDHAGDVQRSAIPAPFPRRATHRPARMRGRRPQMKRADQMAVPIAYPPQECRIQNAST